MYQDFLSISSQLIDNNLKQLLLKHSNNEQDVDFLYNKIIIRKRNACSLLPFKHCSSDWDYMYGEDYIRMINRFSSSKNDELKMFCILYNCIASIFVAGNSGSQTGFDKYIREYVDQGDELSALCESHILVEMVKTGIFGNDAKLIDEKSYHYGKGVYSSKIVSFIISNIFDNDLTSLKKFLKYCVIDIQQNNNITKLKSIYTLNDEANRGHYGISFYVLNRLTYVLYHDLLCMNMKRNNELLFPSLIKFYKFLYNFAVYCHCHTHIGVVEGDTKQKKEYELFYMKEYHRLKNTTYSISKQINIELHRFNYYCGNKFDGSILHCAVYNNFVGYVQLLLKGGFDPSMQNKYYLRQYRTPISIAKTTKKVLMVSLLQEAINSEKKENKENKEDEEKEAEMDMRSLTLRYDSFTNSFMSSIYFLKCLGFNDIYQTIDAKLKMNHELVGKEDSYDNCYWDDFACQMENLIGLKISDSSTSNNNTSGQSDAMVLVVACVESLIKLKMSLSIDLVILACIYSNYCNNYKFFDTLQSTIIECLNGNDNDYKTRNYQWFKHFILNSNVWLVKLPIAHKNQNVSCKDEEKTGQTTTDTAGDVILFDTVVVDVNKLLMKQKEYIWDNVEKIRNDKETNLTFEKLCNFGVNGINTRKELRQDKITNGIMSSVSEFELLLQKVEMGLSAHSSFDLKFENNTKTYLTQCLAFAHANNNTLQSEMKEYFGNKLKIKCKYASAPVKLGNRCIVKATSDYGQKEYPSCANILDFLRFSVTFDNINDLLNGLNTFVNDINQGNVISCVLPNSVLRIKNGFNDILNKWKSVNDASYVDLKLNIVYENIITKQCMIIEAQFLLLFLLKAKKMGHKYYSIVRQEELINNIKNQVYVIDNDNKKYKRKIETFVHNHDSGALMKQLFWKPHVVFSIIVDGGSGFNHFYPLFSEICRQFGVINGKFVLFFLNCLFFHSFVMLDQDDNENNKFLKKYFNWGNGHYTVGGVHTLYHIPLSSIVSSSVQSSIVNLILGKKYLKVLTFNGSHRVCTVLLYNLQVFVSACLKICLFFFWCFF